MGKTTATAFGALGLAAVDTIGAVALEDGGGNETVSKIFKLNFHLGLLLYIDCTPPVVDFLIILEADL